MSTTPAPAEIDYLPTDPVSEAPGIGILGCGNISAKHLAAYHRAGYRVLALCDHHRSRAESRRDEFFPRADVTTDHMKLLRRDDIQVIDITTHVDVRPRLIEDALRAGKHVLSQKPFVRDLDQGRELMKLAERCGVVLAVNQNGRWAPHFAYLLQAADAGLLGDVCTADFAVHWPHDQLVQTDPRFSRMMDLILYDFGIHWFDVIARLFRRSGPAKTVYASVGRTPTQVIGVPTWAQVSVNYGTAAATLILRGSSHRAETGAYRVDGTSGVLQHRGLSLGGSTVEVDTDAGRQTVDLHGDWWDNGMHGAMGEVLSAIEDDRRPSNHAATSLPGLALCFAAMASARSGVPVDPATITTAPN